MAKDKRTKEQKIADCVAGRVAIGFRQNGHGGGQFVVHFCNISSCPKCGQKAADELETRIAKDMAARGVKKLTRLEIQGDLGTEDGKDLRRKINKALRDSDALHTIMPHGDGTFLMHIVGQVDLTKILGNRVITEKRLRAKEVNWFSDCQTSRNKSGTLGKKISAPKVDKPSTAIKTIEPLLKNTLTRDQLTTAWHKAFHRAKKMFGKLPTGGLLSDEEIQAVEVAYQLRAEYLVEEIEALGGICQGYSHYTVFYYGNSSKNLSHSDARECVPKIPERTKRTAKDY